MIMSVNNVKVRQLFIHIFTFICVFFLSRCSNAQIILNQSQEIPVQVNGEVLPNAWAGGMNSPQFSTIDVNGDGLDDLFTFDRDGFESIVFLNMSTIPGESNYQYSPEYSNDFPEMRNWVLLRDYNCDGKKDIFTNFQNSISLYKNISVGNDLQFELVTQQIMCDVDLGGGYIEVPVTCISDDLPAISDYDGDGDIDIITWTETSATLYFYLGMGADNGNCEDLSFEMTNRCYGMLAEASEDNNLFIGEAYGEDITPPDGIADRCGFNVANPRMAINIERTGMHAGGTLTNLDLDQNGIKDLLIGDVTYNNIIAAYFEEAMDSQDSTFEINNAFPVGHGTDVAIDLNRFPGVFYEDINNDGLLDLIAAPNHFVEINDDEGVWMYLNENENDLPSFTFVESNWMQNTMIEHGRGAHPVIVDVNDDNLPDLIVSNDEYYNGFGDKPSQLAYYENIGTLTAPVFDLVDNNFANIPFFQLEHVHPAFGDLDGDGDVDMILGELDGKMHYFENSAGPGEVMNLELSIPIITDANSEPIDVGQYATPQLYDLDGDGLLDIISGEKNGSIKFYKNTGTAENFEFTIFEGDFGINLGNVQANNEANLNGFSVPYLFEEDNEINLLVGNELGEVQWYNDISGNLSGAFNQVENIFQDIHNSKFAACAYDDLNGDSIRDYIQGNNRGGLILFIGDRADVIGIQDLKTSLITIAPNPNNGTFEVRFDQPVQGQIQVFDLQGRMVHESKKLYSDRKQLNLDVQAGLYSVVLINATQRQFLGKIVVK